VGQVRDSWRSSTPTAPYGAGRNWGRRSRAQTGTRLSQTRLVANPERRLVGGFAIGAGSDATRAGDPASLRSSDGRKACQRARRAARW
jgi:hypothetical protein